MKIKFERSQKEKPRKKKKERIVSVGKPRKRVLALWLLLICSLSFGIYKNFTAIDQHTTHEKVIVEEKILNTSGVENFTIDFAKEYFSWENDKDAIEKRMENLEQYLTDEGLTLSQDMVRADIPTSSAVESVKILNVEKQAEEFVVSFLVNQKITEEKNSKQTSSAYNVTIFEDEQGNSIVTSLPTLIGKPKKAEYKEKQLESDSGIDVETTEEMNDFLETFFKIYPTASENELKYYVENETMLQINSNLKFVEISNPIYQQLGNSFQVFIVVKYLNDVEKTTNIFQYHLVLSKDENWKIISYK